MSEDTERRAQLEADRDFLLRSLDDLEVEHESGGIDDESYTELHDDYTARAAAAIRALRDGVDTRPTVPAPPAKRRVAIIAGVVGFALVAGVALAGALGARLPGQTPTGNSQASPSAGSSLSKSQKQQLAAAITSAQKAVNGSPNDYDARLQLADAYARNADLANAMKQWDAAITIDPNRPEANALFGRALYLVAEQTKDKQQQQQFVSEAMAALTAAIQVGPDYADSYFYRGVVNAGIGQYAAAQTDLQTYLVKAPGGQWASNATDLLGKVTTALQTPSTTVPPTAPPAKKK
jgi:tetratricopeptide (TPR) repeat protein